VLCDRTEDPALCSLRRNNQNFHGEVVVSFLQKSIAPTLPTLAEEPGATRLRGVIDASGDSVPLWKTKGNRDALSTVVQPEDKILRERYLRDSGQTIDSNMFLSCPNLPTWRVDALCPGVDTVARPTSVFSCMPKLFFNFSLGSFLG